MVPRLNGDEQHSCGHPQTPTTGDQNHTDGEEECPD